jgi:hypothetical protein
MVNLFTLGLLLIMGELVIRVFSFQTPQGPVFMNITLRPRDWQEESTHYREVWKKATVNGSYFVYDNFLGWTVGPNRRSIDGLNFSSVEGIRSPRTDMAFADIPAAHRIALVGDSYTFGLEVKYEETWGYQLERELGKEFQVLNFGVDGFGVDQAYLRYYRDVRPWRPDFVIFGVFPHDLERTMAVYPFIDFQWEIPFAKPRFIFHEWQLKLLNVPLPIPEAIFSKSSVANLSFVKYDRGYNPADWQWSYYHSLYLFRFLISAFPVWYTPGKNTFNEEARFIDDEAIKSLNSALLNSFIRLATAEGSTPIVVYFPARRDFPSPSLSYPESGRGFTSRILQSAGIAYIDLFPCLEEINPSDRFINGMHHYTPQANAAVAKCLEEAILR